MIPGSGGSGRKRDKYQGRRRNAPAVAAVTSAEAAAAVARERLRGFVLLVWAPPSERKLERGKDQVFIQFIILHRLTWAGPDQAVCIGTKIFQSHFI
jgi:hypothetical protein